jgi:hypothetical protein
MFEEEEPALEKLSFVSIDNNRFLLSTEKLFLEPE